MTSIDTGPALLEVMQASFQDELYKIAESQKEATELTEAAREHIKTKNFALSAKQSDTGKPAYPIEDRRHAANALARVKQFGDPKEKAEVYKDVAKKYPEMAAKSDVPAMKAKAEKEKKASVMRSALRSAAELLKEAAEPPPGLLRRLGGKLAGPKGLAATELAGLGVLAVPGADTLQAKLRSRGDPENWEKKRLLGEGAHAAADVGGLGILAAPEVHHLLSRTAHV